MRYQLIIAIVLFASTPASASDTMFQFGIANTWPRSLACVTFQGQELKPGQTIYVIAFDPQRWVRGQVVEKRTTPCNEQGALDGTVYDARLEQADTVEDQLGVAVVAPNATVAVENKAVVLVSRLDRRPVVFRRCTSGEGIHFLAWQGGKLLWHEYYYLGYDVEPTCSEEELEKQGR